MSYTLSQLTVSEEAYNEIAQKLRDAEYDHAFLEGGMLDMHGIGLVAGKKKEKKTEPVKEEIATVQPFKTFVKLTEYNDWEGETWNFYIPVAGNGDALKELKSKVDTLTEYTLDLENPLTEDQVDTLVKHSNSGYMMEHNKLSGLLDTAQLSVEGLYKGGIKQCMKPA